MLWWLLLLLPILLIAYLLLAPFYLFISSIDKELAFRYHYMAFADFKIIDNTPILRLKVFWWRREFNLFKLSKRTKNTEKEPVKKPVTKSKRKSKWMKPTVRKIWMLIRSFKVNQCLIAIDTGDMQLNAYLFPLFYWIGRRSGEKIGINFEDENIFVLEIENRLGRMLWAYLKN